jgi:hypothetical protein
VLEAVAPVAKSIRIDPGGAGIRVGGGSVGVGGIGVADAGMAVAGIVGVIAGVKACKVAAT